MRAPLGADRWSGSESIAQACRNEATSDERFVVGQAVRTLATVRPCRYADRVGLVIAADGDEIAVRFGSPSSHSLSIAFRRREIAAIEVGQALLSGPGSLGSATPGCWESASQK